MSGLPLGEMHGGWRQPNKRGEESKHNRLSCPVLDVAFLLPHGALSWSGLLPSNFARLMKAADARVRWPQRGPRRRAGSSRTGRILRGSPNQYERTTRPARVGLGYRRWQQISIVPPH